MNSSTTPRKAPKLRSTTNRGQKSDELHWIRRFWVGLAAMGILAASLVFTYGQNDESDEDIYVAIQINAKAGDDQNIICNLSLLIDPEQEKRIKARQSQLQAIASQSLVASYNENSRRPSLSSVRTQLYRDINSQLPRKLQIRDVLIQDLLFGIS